MWKYHVPLLPLYFLCATHQSTGLWFAAKKTARLWLGLLPTLPQLAAFHWKQSSVFVFSALLEKKDGGYLGLPVSVAFVVHVKETFPSAHSELASAPLAKTSERRNLGFQLQIQDS